MHSSMSMLLTVIERVRGLLDDPVVDAKYDNQFLVNHLIGPSMADVYARINMTRDNPVLIRHMITLVAGQEDYQLPAMIGAVWRFAMVDDQGNVVQEYLPRGVFHPSGPGWELQENLLVLRPVPTAVAEIDIWYTPSGQYLPHYATDGLLSPDGSTLTLSTNPYLGMVDRRDEAYAGSIVRLLPESGMIEERVVASHDVCAGTVTVRRPFTACGTFPDSSSSSSESGADEDRVIYEMAPQGCQGMYDAISCRTAIRLAAYRNTTMKQRGFYLDEYKSAMKTLRDLLSNLQLRTGKYHQKRTVDNDTNWITALYAI